MPEFLLDTDHLTLYHHKHPAVMRQLATHPPDAAGISPISIQETMRGRLAPLARALKGIAHVEAYARLVTAVELFSLFPLVPFDQTSEDQYQQLRTARVRVGSQDLKIGAIALANNLIVLTRNSRDFGQIPGLQLADWSV
jgi:tRNA(fMet)-specific endonuclease VapC